MDQKKRLLQQLQMAVEAELQTLQKSLESAAEAATHPESKPENKYDTRGLEASYLAGAQKERLAELKGALILLQEMRVRTFTADDKVAPTALIRLDQDRQESLCFLLVWGAGYKLEVDGQPVLTITPQSPLGKALMNKGIGETVTVRTHVGAKHYEILEIS